MRTTLLLTAALLSLAMAAAAQVTTVPVVRITTDMDIKAAPAAVWKQLTEGKNLVTWCPVWKSAKNSSVRLTKVGDTLDFTDQWGNGGRSIVTFLEPNRELRVAHEPQDGSYLCQSRVTLTAAGAATHVTWIEQYTDSSPETDRNATSAKMKTEMASTLSTLKSHAEMAPAGGAK